MFKSQNKISTINLHLTTDKQTKRMISNAYNTKLNRGSPVGRTTENPRM